MISRRRVVRQRVFQDSVAHLTAGRTENVSFLKPIRFTLYPLERCHRLHHLLFAAHPPAKQLSSVLMNYFDLIFTAVIVRIVCHVASRRAAEESTLPSGSGGSSS